MLFFRKLFKLPSPLELGVSRHDSLPSRKFTPDATGFCWEDWHALVKANYPIRYFFGETCADFLKYKVWYKIYRPISTLSYFLVSHLIPSRRYHMLDLRQPCDKQDVSNIDCYRYGWHDVPEKMLFAIFNLLGEYLNKENPFDLSTEYSDEEIQDDDQLKYQHNCYLEAKAIYHWWTVERKQELIYLNDLRASWFEKPKGEERKSARLFVDQAEINFELKTDDMIARLFKIRRTLWT